MGKGCNAVYAADRNKFLPQCSLNIHVKLCRDAGFLQRNPQRLGSMAHTAVHFAQNNFSGTRRLGDDAGGLDC